jgi:predicted nucleic acid-binding protein
LTGLLALLDSNVVVASIAEGHQHHEPSNALFQSFPAQSFAVAAHSYAEAYSILTRKSANSFCKRPADVIAALESVAARCVLVGLTHAQTFDAIREFASGDGIGPRLYDKLIGQTAVLNGLDAIVTWNLAHMRSLFPALDVLDPAEFARQRRSAPKGRRPKK